MAQSTRKDFQVAQLLGSLSQQCDKGFALAVHIRLTRPTLLYQTYDQAWSEHYSVNGYMLSDPVVHWGLTNTGWVEWESLSGQDPAGVIAAAKAHGLLNGWTYSVGSPSSRTIAGLPRSSGPFSADERRAMAAIVDEIHDLTEGFEDLPAAMQDRLRKLP